MIVVLFLVVLPRVVYLAQDFLQRHFLQQHLKVVPKQNQQHQKRVVPLLQPREGRKLVQQAQMQRVAVLVLLVPLVVVVVVVVVLQKVVQKVVPVVLLVLPRKREHQVQPRQVQVLTKREH